nr:uncharacterized protein LOC111419021 [Onthophagus taurus]
MLYKIVLLIIWISSAQGDIPAYFFQLFSFECPKGFIQNGLNCLIPSHNFCPDINKLNTFYYITPKKNNDLEHVIKNSKHFCKYSISKFFEVENSNNWVTINFATDEDTNKPNLYLDVISIEEINNLDKKVHCYTDRYGKNMRKVKLSNVFKVEGRTRFLLEIDDTLSRYVCYFLDAGKIKPKFTAPALASTRANNIFIPDYEPSCIDDLENITSIKSFEKLNDDFINKENIDDLITNISDLIVPLVCFGLNTNITSDKYCFPTVSGKENEINWPLTPAMSWTVPFESCYDEVGDPITRKCILDEDGPRWEEVVNDYCEINDYYDDYAFEDMDQLESAEVY